MDQVDFDGINKSIMSFNEKLRILINSTHDEKIVQFLNGVITGNNFCRSWVHGYTRTEDKCVLNPDKRQYDEAVK